MNARLEIQYKNVGWGRIRWRKHSYWTGRQKNIGDHIALLERYWSLNFRVVQKLGRKVIKVVYPKESK